MHKDCNHMIIHNDGKIILYSPQDEVVWDALKADGIIFSKRDYVKEKYAESAPIFLTAYDAYVRMAEGIVPRPDGSEYPYWASASEEMVDLSGGSRTMVLEVPMNEAVFFDIFDWYKLLRLSYIGESEKEEKEFVRELERRGIRDSSEAVLKPFYPDMKRIITDSWNKLLRYDGAIRRGDDSSVSYVQAGLWRIKREWLRNE